MEYCQWTFHQWNARANRHRCSFQTATHSMSSPGLTGRSSIPETAVLNRDASGILDARLRGHDSGEDVSPHPRGTKCPGDASTTSLLKTEGAGNAGRPMRPIAACAMLLVERTRVSQVTPESPGIPRA